jgi:hypothetical protein
MSLRAPPVGRYGYKAIEVIVRDLMVTPFVPLSIFSAPEHRTYPPC